MYKSVIYLCKQHSRRTNLDPAAFRGGSSDGKPTEPGGSGAFKLGSRSHGPKRKVCTSRTFTLSAHRGMRVDFRSLTGACAARRWDLDRAGRGKSWLAPLRRVAGSPNQSAGPTVRYGLACANDRTNTKSGAGAGWHLLGNNRGGPPPIKTCARFQGHWEVFGGYRQPYSGNPVLPGSPGHGHPASRTRLSRKRRSRSRRGRAGDGLFFGRLVGGVRAHRDKTEHRLDVGFL